MGIFSLANNRKKTTDREKHAMKWKRHLKAVKKATKGPIPVDIKDANLFSPELMRNKLKNPRNNIDISNKKRKRILKRLKHQQLNERQNEDEEEGDDFEMLETKTASLAPDNKAASTSTSASSNDPQASSSSSVPAKTRKNRKRGGKNRRKGKGSASGGDGADVEMEEI